MGKYSATHPPAARPDWAFFLDFDGTLTEIASTPEAALADAELLRMVARLSAVTGGAVALVSGRQLSDLDARFSGLRLPMAGQHGLERRDTEGRLFKPVAVSHEMLGLRAQMAAMAARYRDLRLEDKGMTLALHYRQAPRLGPYVHRMLKGFIGASGPDLCLQKGKRVLEVKPCGFDKGTAVASFMQEPPFSGRRPVFIGDDVTDETAFAVVNAMGGITIKVGAGRSVAHWRLRDVRAVRAWLSGASSAKGGFPSLRPEDAEDVCR